MGRERGRRAWNEKDENDRKDAKELYNNYIL
jgi:hypothetical protein